MVEALGASGVGIAQQLHGPISRNLRARDGGPARLVQSGFVFEAVALAADCLDCGGEIRSAPAADGLGLAQRF